jgi:hypothetical protein
MDTATETERELVGTTEAAEILGVGVGVGEGEVVVLGVSAPLPVPLAA